MTHDEMLKVAGDAKAFWPVFEDKISTFFPLLTNRDVFVRYSEYILRKFIQNGYDRIEFRALLTKLKDYDEKGGFVKEYDEEEYGKAFDEAFERVKKDHPTLTVGFIFFGLKALSDEENETILRKICQVNWNKTIGLDFVQEEDPYGSIEKYDKIADKVLMDFPHLDYKKCYHAGDTRDHTNDNIEIAVKAGSVRLGHGLNILQRIEFLPHCKNVCFEKNPISNIVTAASKKLDLRLASAPVLLGLGYPVSISPDDPGKFGYEDTTVDFFCAAVSYNWTLKHLKLTIIHSINHAICTEGVRINLLNAFSARWEAWINEFIK